MNTRENNKKLEVITPGMIAWKKFRKNKLAIIGAVLLICIVFSCILVPILSPYKINDFNLEDKKQPPSAKHWLGTDEQGRDILTRVFLGGRISLLVGILAATITVILGSIVGAVAGFYGGITDSILMRFSEIVSSLPFIPLVITISASLMWVESKYKMFIVMIVIGLLSWPGLARIVRGQILSLREQEYMQAAEALGISDISKIFRHLLPNTLSYIIVNATLCMASAILTEAGLSFLGLGVTPPTPTWGNMIERARTSIVFKNYPWMWIPPGFLITLTVVSINLLGEGLKDAFDPKQLR